MLTSTHKVPGPGEVADNDSAGRDVVLELVVLLVVLELVVVELVVLLVVLELVVVELVVLLVELVVLGGVDRL